MQPTKSNRSYSDFFTSGFRAMTSRTRRRLSSIYANPMTLQNSAPTEGSFAAAATATAAAPATATATSTTRRHNFRNVTNRRSRAMSMIASPPLSIKTDTSSRHRRSSVVTLSSWLFDRKPYSSDNYSFSRSPPKNSRELHGSTDITEVWITAGGPYTLSNVSKFSDEMSMSGPIDPFAASPDSKSIFIELSEPSPTPNPKRESFLSFSSSSPDRSFLHLPRRERPTSVQTMPLPSRSRRSSYHYRPPSQGKSDFSWTLTEESPTSTSESLAEDYEWVDPAQGIDWRQFHIELLRDEA